MKNHSARIVTLPVVSIRAVYRDGRLSIQRKRYEETDYGPISRWMGVWRWSR